MEEHWLCKPRVMGSSPITFHLYKPFWGCSSIGRALALQAEGYGFESHHVPLKLKKREKKMKFNMFNMIVKNGGRKNGNHQWQFVGNFIERIEPGALQL